MKNAASAQRARANVNVRAPVAGPGICERSEQIPEIIKKLTLFGNYNLLTTLQNLHKILLHIDVDSAVTGKCTASFAVAGEGRAKTNAYIAGGVEDVGADIFARGLCLPSDNKMTAEQQDRIIEVIRRCFE